MSGENLHQSVSQSGSESVSHSVNSGGEVKLSTVDQSVAQHVAPCFNVILLSSKLLKFSK